MKNENVVKRLRLNKISEKGYKKVHFKIIIKIREKIIQ